MSNPDEIYDQWLVLRCQGGDASALAALVQRWQPRLLGFAVRILGDREAAEDAVQSCWVDVVRRINSVRDPKSIRSWLFRIVANKCADTIRKRSKRRQLESTTRTDQVADSTEEKKQTATRHTENILRLRDAMKRLDASHREILRMHYLDGLSVRDIADRLSIPPGTVKSRLYHARQKLKQSLSGEKE